MRDHRSDVRRKQGSMPILRVAGQEDQPKAPLPFRHPLGQSFAAKSESNDEDLA
jgi:hypothetical protein